MSVFILVFLTLIIWTNNPSYGQDDASKDTYFYATRSLKKFQLEAGYKFNYSKTDEYNLWLINSFGQPTLKILSVKTIRNSIQTEIGLTNWLSVGVDAYTNRDVIVQKIDKREATTSTYYLKPHLTLLLLKTERSGLQFQTTFTTKIDTISGNSHLEITPGFVHYFQLSEKGILVNQLSCHFNDKKSSEALRPIDFQYTTMGAYAIITEFMILAYYSYSGSYGNDVRTEEAYEKLRYSHNGGIGIQYRLAKQLYGTVVYNQPIISANYDGFSFVEIGIRKTMN